MRWWLGLLLLLIGIAPLPGKSVELRLGSKKFTENVILGEMLAQLAAAENLTHVHYQELGGSRLVFEALRNGSIDAYPEYTGTLLQELLGETAPLELDAAREYLGSMGIAVSRPLGFNNTYAISMLRERADEMQIRTISDLKRFPELRLGFTSEFIERGDGWPALRDHYGLPHRQVAGLDHDIAYRQLESGAIDVMDAYSTDAKIKKLGLVTLQDDRQFFPEYECVILYRRQLEERFPRFIGHLRSLEGRIDEARMIDLNYQAESLSLSETEVARGFLADVLSVRLNDQATADRLGTRLWQRTLEHLDLVRKSLIPAILCGIPLGIIAFRWKRLGSAILACTGIIQTIPALALLVLIMPVIALLNLPSLGTGSTTAVAALFLYSLLPIVMGTYTGLNSIEVQYVESAAALGLSTGYRLRKVELPLAARSILSGIKTAAVINVGFATLGALIGAGGYGQPILTGIRRADTWTLLEGAVPAALLAIAMQLLFEWLEPLFVSRGLRS